MDSRFVNPDNDPRGKWSSMPLHAKSGKEEDRYSITFPNGVTWDCPVGSYPTFRKERLLELYHDNRLWFGPAEKRDRDEKRPSPKLDKARRQALYYSTKMRQILKRRMWNCELY